MTCIKCRTEMLPTRVLEMTGTFKGETITVEVAGRECPNCGHKAIQGRQTAEFMQKVSDAYRERHQLLTSAEIRRARERLGMSQAEFAIYLGVGIASVKRWELGELQTRTVDELIRIKTDPAYAEAFVTRLYQRLASAKEQSARPATARRKRATSTALTCELLAA